MGDPPVQHDRRPVGHAEGRLRELLDEEDGHTAGGDGRHELVEVCHDDRREAHGDLVEEEDPGLTGQGPRDGEHLLLSARERACELLAAPLEAGEVLIGTRLDLRSADAAAVGPHAQVVAHGQVGEHAAPLGDGDHAGARQGLGCPARWRQAVDGDRAGGRVEAATDHLEQRALPRPVGPEEREDGAAGDGEVHAVEHLDAPVGGVDVLDRQAPSGAGGHRSPASPSAPMSACSRASLAWPR